MGKLQCSTCKTWVSEYSGKCKCGFDGEHLRSVYELIQGLIDSRAFDDEENYPQYWLCEKCNSRNVYKIGDYKSQHCKYCGSSR